jgi:hypothetical protein
VLILEGRSLLRISTASSSLHVMMMMMMIPSPIATDNLLSREKLEFFLSIYQELQTKVKCPRKLHSRVLTHF